MTTVAELMSHPVDCVAVGATLGEAALRMLEGRISSVIVVDGERVLGIVTERDMLHAMRQHQGHAQPVTAAMTSPVHMVSAHLDFREAFQTAARLGIRHLVVADVRGQPLGVVSESDFRRHLGLDFFRQMNTVDVLMERSFPRLPAAASLDEALLAMEAVRGSCVVVVAGEQALGIVTERDVVRLYLEQDGNPSLGEVMTQPVAAVRVDTPLAEAAEYMLTARIRHLVVRDGAGRLVGLLTEHSLMRPLELDLLDQALVDRRQLAVAHDADRGLISRNERYQRALLDNFPFLVWLKDTESRFLAVNRPFAEAAGQSSIDYFPGKTDLDIWPRDLAEQYRADDAAVMASGEKQYVTEQVVDRGIRHWFETYKAPVVDDDGVLLGTVGFACDISARQRAAEATLLRNAALAGLLRGEALAGALEQVALSIEAELPGALCAILTPRADGGHLALAAAPRLPEAWRRAIDGMAIGEGVGGSGTAAFRRDRVLIADVASDPFCQSYRAAARAAGIVSCWSVPVLGTQGELLAVFSTYHATPGRPEPWQETLLTQGSQLLGLILTQQANVRRLHDSVDTFHGIFDSVSEALFVQAEDGVFLNANAAAALMFGRPRAELVGRSHVALAAEGLNDLARIQASLAEAIAGAARCFEFWGKDGAGRTFPVQVNLHPGNYFGQHVVIASMQDIGERKAAEQRLRIEHDLAQALATGMPRDAVLSTLLDIALRLPEFDGGGVYWRAPDGAYRLCLQRGLSADFAARVDTLAADAPLAEIVRAGEVVCRCEQLSALCAAPLLPAEWLAAEGVRCLAVLPVLVAGAPVACLALAGRQASQVSRGTFAVLQALRQYFADTLLRLDAHEEAARLQQNLSGLFDTLKDFLFVIDGAGRIQHYNRAVSEQLGYGDSALKGQPLLAVHPVDMRDMVGQPNRGPLPVVRRDGSRLMVESRVVAGYWNGQPALFGVAQDITERLLAEERQQLAASVFENAHEGIMITDARGRIVEVNPTFSELTGYSRGEAIGRTTDLLKSGHHEPGFYADMWRTIQQQGYWRGEVWNRKKSGEIFVELLTISSVRNRDGAISHFVGIFSDITLLKEHQQRLEHLAHFDALTQLPNRMLLADRLQLAMAQTERGSTTLAVGYLDLDGFKAVNDELGHATGDRLLVEVAQRLRQCVRAGDTVARLGGDEFVLLFSGLEDVHECDRAVTRVLSSLAAPFHLAGKDVLISASIGVTLYPTDGADADTLLRHADQAMYTAKQSGRNRFHLFDPESDRRTRVRREEISRLRQALADQEFVLYYQPKVNMREGRVCGAEALIRWRHPAQGLLLPKQFLPAIEGSVEDVQLGEWVLQEALRQMAVWQAAGLPLAVSVNISGTHLQTPGFVERLAALLAACPSVPAHCLELEILETAALEDVAQAAEVFAACRRLGVSLALDDFGTGYSSLTYFRRLPADVLKIDQSFVRDMLDDPDDLAIVEGIVGLTQAFHRKVIAEGVETPEHGMLLLQLGCDLAQGYGIAHPMPAADFPGWVTRFVPNPLWSCIASFQWAREDLPMLVADGDHLRWLHSLDLYLADPRGAPGTLVREHGNCRFARWYYGPARERYGHLESYRSLEGVHARVHSLGDELLDLAPLGDPALLAERRAELEVAGAALSEAIQRLQAEVLIGNQPSLR